MSNFAKKLENAFSDVIDFKHLKNTMTPQEYKSFISDDEFLRNLGIHKQDMINAQKKYNQFRAGIDKIAKIGREGSAKVTDFLTASANFGGPELGYETPVIGPMKEFLDSKTGKIIQVAIPIFAAASGLAAYGSMETNASGVETFVPENTQIMDNHMTKMHDAAVSDSLFTRNFLDVDGDVAKVKLEEKLEGTLFRMSALYDSTDVPYGLIDTDDVPQTNQNQGVVLANVFNDAMLEGQYNPADSVQTANAKSDLAQVFKANEWVAQSVADSVIVDNIEIIPSEENPGKITEILYHSKMTTRGRKDSDNHVNIANNEKVLVPYSILSTKRKTQLDDSITLDYVGKIVETMQNAREEILDAIAPSSDKGTNISRVEMLDIIKKEKEFNAAKEAYETMFKYGLSPENKAKLGGTYDLHQAFMDGLFAKYGICKDEETQLGNTNNTGYRVGAGWSVIGGNSSIDFEASKTWNVELYITDDITLGLRSSGMKAPADSSKNLPRETKDLGGGMTGATDKRVSESYSDSRDLNAFVRFGKDVKFTPNYSVNAGLSVGAGIVPFSGKKNTYETETIIYPSGFEDVGAERKVDSENINSTHPVIPLEGDVIVPLGKGLEAKVAVGKVFDLETGDSADAYRVNLQYQF